MTMPISSAKVFCAAIAAGIAIGTSSASAALLDVYGSPEYTPGVGGFQNGQAHAVNNDGMAVGFALRYDASDAYLGQRAVRWGPGIAATELGNLGTDNSGRGESRAIGINDAGTAVGHSSAYSDSGRNFGRRAVRWESSGTAPSELGTLDTNTDGMDYVAFAVNDAGTTVGLGQKHNGTVRTSPAVRWDASGTAATELGNLGTDPWGRTDSRARAVNTAGTAVGNAEKFDTSGASLGSRAVRWNASKTAAIELGNLGTSSSGSTSATAGDVNDAGTAVGSAVKYDASGMELGSRAVRWDASGTMATELGDLGTNSSGMTTSRAVAINDAGTAVGVALKYDALGTDLSNRAVRWDAGGTAATELGNLGTSTGGVTAMYVNDLNDAGIAVGYADDYDDFGSLIGRKAVYWGADGAAVDLNTLIDPASGWTLNRADAISDTSWIAGSGLFDPDGAGGQAAYTRLFALQSICHSIVAA